MYVPQYEEELFTWSRQQNVALEQINAYFQLKDLRNDKSSSLASTTRASCATLQETLGLIPLVIPSSVSTDHHPQGGGLKCRVSNGREEGPISSSN